MNQLNISENLIRLRHEKKITQEQLADFLGITKASVSKWETGQSLPDLLLLPRLAAFFDVSVDTLIGYEPQLGKEQIRKLYAELSGDFSRLPFGQVMDKCRALTRRYYSCYPFLLQICILYVNHYNFGPDEAEQRRVLSEAAALCAHIRKDCGMISVCNDAVVLNAMLDMLLGDPQRAAESLTGVYDPVRLSNSADALLVQACAMTGKLKEALDYTQICMYTHLLALVGAGTQYMALNISSPEVCEATMERMDGIMKAYRLDRLHPNCAAQYYYQAAMVHMQNGDPGAALRRLDSYADAIILLLSEDCRLHGDDYFDRLEPWFEKLDLGVNPPRSPGLVTDSIADTLKNPVFAPLWELKEFERIRNKLEQKIRRTDQ